MRDEGERMNHAASSGFCSDKLSHRNLFRLFGCDLSACDQGDAMQSASMTEVTSGDRNAPALVAHPDRYILENNKASLVLDASR